MRTNPFSQLLTILATAAVLTVARPVIAAEGARSAETPAARRVVVSIPDRKLALIENNQIVSIYPVAVGAPVSPSPVGTFTHRQSRVESDLLQDRQGRRPGPRESGRHPVDRTQRRRATASTAPTHRPRSASPSRTAASAFAIGTSNSSSSACAPATSSSCTPSARRRSRNFRRGPGNRFTFVSHEEDVMLLLKYLVDGRVASGFFSAAVRACSSSTSSTPFALAER